MCNSTGSKSSHLQLERVSDALELTFSCLLRCDMNRIVPIIVLQASLGSPSPILGVSSLDFGPLSMSGLFFMGHAGRPFSDDSSIQRFHASDICCVAIFRWNLEAS